MYRVVTDFRVLNERLVRVNYAFPIVRDCLEAIGASKCEVMSVLDLRDAYHILPLAEESQKYCGLTPYYGSPTYVYLRMGNGNVMQSSSMATICAYHLGTIAK